MGVEWIPIVFGLGFVLSFGYWTTNFAEVQRAMAAKSLDDAARRTPLIGAYPKMFIPVLSHPPGMIALVTIKGLGGDDPNMEYNNAIPLLMNEYLPNGMLGLALVALMAAFMSGMAANVTAFNTVVTYDLYQPYVKEGQQRRLLPQLRPHRDRRGHRDRRRHGADRLGLQQHHGLHPAVVLVLQRAAVRDVHHRHVLEADDAVGGLLGPARGHGRRGDRALRERVGLVRPRLRAGGRLLGRDRRLRADAIVSVAVTFVTTPKPVDELDGLVYGMAVVDEEEPRPTGSGTAGRPRSPPARSASPPSSASSSPKETPMPEDKFIAEAEEAERRPPPRAPPTLFDVRRFIGGLFLIYGVILLILGIGASDADDRQGGGVNINLWTGLAMLVVGAIFLAWALTGRSAKSSPMRSQSRRRRAPGRH